MLAASAVAALEPHSHLQHFINRNLRVDGRGFRAIRSIGVSHDPLAISSLSRSGAVADDNLASASSASASASAAPASAPASTSTVSSTCPASVAGSALVSLGATRVLASVSLQVGVPDLAAPADGDVEVNVSYAPFSSRQNSAGSRQPAERATALSEIFRDLLLKGRVLDLCDLCIEERRCAWKVCVAVLVLNDDGGVFDAGLVAAVAALEGVMLPATLLDEEGVVKLVRGQPRTRLPLKTSLTPLTCGVVREREGNSQKTLLADLSGAEEHLVSATITVVCDGDGKLCGLFKSGGDAVAATVVEECVSICLERCKTLELATARQSTSDGASPAKKRRRTAA